MGKTSSKEKTSTGNADLDLAIVGINKKFGDGALMRLGDATKMNVSVISTGSIAVDLALGVGGLPRGRTVEIYGPESSGKTTFCLSVIAEAQRKGGNAVFVDVEHALDPRYAKIVGVDLDNLMISQPESGEDALNITETLIRSAAIDVIVIDSVAALVSRQELDGQMGDTTVGLQARMMSQAMRKLTGAIADSGRKASVTKVVAEIDGRRLLIGGNADGAVYGIEVHTGRKVWGFGLSKRGLNVSVVVAGDRVYAAHSEENLDTTTMGRVVCIDGTGTGDITKSHEVWRVDGIEAGYSSPALADGRRRRRHGHVQFGRFDPRFRARQLPVRP